MLTMGRRRTGVTIGGLVPSLVLSLLASAAATYLLRQLLSTNTGMGRTNGPEEGQPSGGNVTVAVPVVVLTIVSGNRWAIGRRGGMPPPFFLPFLVARLIRKKRQQQRGWQRRRR